MSATVYQTLSLSAWKAAVAASSRLPASWTLKYGVARGIYNIQTAYATSNTSTSNQHIHLGNFFTQAMGPSIANGTCWYLP